MGFERVLVGGAAALVLAAGSLGALAATSLASPQTTRMPLCLTSGPVAGLTDAQAANARIVAGVASGRAGHAGSLIAVMTAMPESGLLILSNPNDPAGNGLPSQGVGYDHDSLGLFQQRPSWGTAAQRMDPVESTNLFLDALLKLDGWADLAPWEAAQAVQRSAFTGSPSPTNRWSAVVGGNYLAHLPQAQGVLAVVDGDAGALDCGASDEALQPGDAIHFGLPQEYAIPADASPRARVAITYALAQLGKPYLWGGTGPAAFDCSGLTQEAWLHAGVSIGRTTGDQVHAGTPTTYQLLQPGDLILIPGAHGTIAAPGHVGMYLGLGLVIHAPKTGDVIHVTNLSAFTHGGVSALRSPDHPSRTFLASLAAQEMKSEVGSLARAPDVMRPAVGSPSGQSERNAEPLAARAATFSMMRSMTRSGAFHFIASRS